MLVAVFNPTTSWSTRTITYDAAGRRLMLQDGGLIAAQKVLEHDAQGQIDWAREGLREWVGEFAEWERVYRPQLSDATRVAATRDELPFSGIPTLTLPRPAAPAGRPPRRRPPRILLVALTVAAAAVAAVALGRLIESDSATPGKARVPTPTKIAKIIDPVVVESPAITRFVNLLDRADGHVADAWANGSSEEYRAAKADLRSALAGQPHDDGSRQWAYARKCALRMSALVKCEGRVMRDARSGTVTEFNSDSRTFHRLAARKDKAMDAYFAYVYIQNWAGYCAVGRHFTSVTATWRQPRLYKVGSTMRRVDIWVGLDGDSNTMCEQTGIGMAQWSSDRPTDYWAWYEMLPKPPVELNEARPIWGSGSRDMVVKAGDTVTATVTSLGGHRFRLTLVDSTQDETCSVIKTNKAARCDSAEIIVEAHLHTGMGLADFEPVHFTSCDVDGRPISAFRREETHIAAIGDLALTRTSALEADGTSFTETRR
jgi:hypothetical protein